MNRITFPKPENEVRTLILKMPRKTSNTDDCIDSALSWAHTQGHCKRGSGGERVLVNPFSRFSKTTDFFAKILGFKGRGSY